MIHLKVLPVADPVVASARYLSADYTLEVAPHGVDLSEAQQVAFDTLTLLFTRDDHTLFGLDAYTNAKAWSQELLHPPRPDDTAALIPRDRFDVHGIGPGSPAVLHYSFSPSTSVLRIRFGEGDVAAWIRCFSCAVVGLSRDGQLLEAWLEHLDIVPGPVPS